MTSLNELWDMAGGAWSALDIRQRNPDLQIKAGLPMFGASAIRGIPAVLQGGRAIPASQLGVGGPISQGGGFALGYIGLGALIYPSANIIGKTLFPETESSSGIPSQMKAHIPDSILEQRRLERSQYYDRIEKEQNDIVSDQLPEGATVLPNGQISYYGQIYEAKMPSGYSKVDTQGPYLYKPFNYAGYYNWPSRFYGRNSDYRP